MGDKIKIKLLKKNKTNNALSKAVYLVRYGEKFEKFGLAKNFVYKIIDEPEGIDIISLIDVSETKEQFSENVRKYLKSKNFHPYSQSLLLGNLTGNYDMHYRCSSSLQEINIDAFSKENLDLVQVLREHFAEYILCNNKRKNIFAERSDIGISNHKICCKNLIKDLKKEDLLEFFDLALTNKTATLGDNLDEARFKCFAEYVISTIGTYSREDIKNNFDFILYDLDNANNKNLNERRERWQSLKGLSIEQIKKIDQVKTLKHRLQNMSSYPAIVLKARLDEIDDNLKENIAELEDIYLDYELLCRQDLLDNLFVSEKDVTLVSNYQDIRPQLIHQFLRNVDSFREKEYDKIKEKIISERTPKNNSPKLSEEENKNFEKMKNKVEANINQYKVNHSIDNAGGIYSDANGLEFYESDTSNQISAQLFTKENVLNQQVGIVGIGFNSENLTPEAIAISSNSYKTTNKGLNNLEYNENKDFEELSSPFQELENASKSEIVLQRRGIDFDTKASYIFAIIDSSDKEKTEKIMEELKTLQEKEKLKAVIYDKYLISQSLQEPSL